MAIEFFGATTIFSELTALIYLHQVRKLLRSDLTVCQFLWIKTQAYVHLQKIAKNMPNGEGFHWYNLSFVAFAGKVFVS